MCNCKGWDLIYIDNKVSVTPHFCRVLDDCGHRNNTLDEAADCVVDTYQREYEYIQSLAKDPDTRYLYDTERLMEVVSNITQWENRTHPDYLFYKEQS